MFENKKILILGMARSGYEAAKLLMSRNNKVIVNSNKIDEDSSHVEELKNLGVEVILGDHPDGLLTRDFDYLIKNPGIKNDHKYVKDAEEYGIPVINEVELAYSLMPKDITLIGITGSNGKTTTTTIIYEIIKASGKPVHLTGNIGFPLAGFVDVVKSGDIVVMEVSIQQLINLDKFKTNISVLTNIYESHLDFVDGFDNYKNLKKRIFNHHTKNDYAVLNFDNEDVMKLTNDIASSRVYFSSTREFSDGCYIKDDNIYYKDEFIISTKDLLLTGKHIYEDFMAAIAVSKIIGVDNNTIVNVIKNFKGVEHRCEFVKKINDRSFYNDSKATNVTATKVAVSAFTNPTILLLGGLDRGHSFDELIPYMKNVKLVVCYGETKNRIKDFCDRINIECIVVDNLTDATHKAYDSSSAGDTILLSPACASWDQFTDYEKRGDLFKEIVNKL